MRTPEHTLRLFPLFDALSFTPVMTPVLVLFWQDNGLDTFDVYLLQALFAGANAVLEVPTGMVADRIGKRASLLVGQCIVAVGSVLYELGSGFWSFLAAEVTLALGMSLLSGADSALLFDTLHRLGRSASYSAYEGRSHSVRLLVFAVCNVVGGLAGEASLRSAVWLSCIGPVLAVPLVWSFSEGPAPAAPRTFREAAEGYRALMGASLRFVARHALVRWVIAFQAVLVGSATWLLWSYQPYLTRVGLPVWSFGLVFALYNLAAALASRLSGRFVDTFGEKGALVAFGALQVLPPLGMGLLVGPWSCLFVLGQQAVRGLARPVLNARILAYTWPDKRATVLSLASLVSRGFFLLTGPLVGLVGERLALPQALVVRGAAVAALLGGLAFAWTRIPAKHFVPKPAPGAMT